MVMHLDAAVGLSRLTATLERARQQAGRDERAVPASLTVPCAPVDPLTFFQAASRYRDRSLWFQPSHQFALVGAGVAQAIEIDRDDRFEAARAARRDLLKHAVVDGLDDALRATGPVLLGGFSFDPRREGTGMWSGFPATRLILPRLLLTVRDGRHVLTLNSLVEPDADPDQEARDLLAEIDVLLDAVQSTQSPAEAGCRVALTEARPACDWQQVVADASAVIRLGEAEKIVLAREVRLETDAPFSVAAALDRLVDAYPTCYVFAFDHDDRVFLGATPERLVEMDGNELKAACLAGSERRGATAEEDRLLGESLLNSRKDQEEHAIVVRALTEGLSGLCHQLIMPDKPELLSVSNVHHLYTPIVARLRDGVCILDAVERLHPTPAVGGFPRDTALAFIRAHEGMDRGWYASPVGWVGPDGGGEFAVALRSALVDGNHAALFAGCGIMGDSDPQREYEESALKLRPMLGALRGEAK